LSWTHQELTTETSLL